MSRFAPFARRTSSQTTQRAARKHRQRQAADASVPLRDRFSPLELLENRTLLSTYQVTNLSDTSDTSSPDYAGSLRWAITQANLNPGADTITFDTSLAGSITLASGLPAITEQVAIVGNTDGHGAPIVAIDGSGDFVDSANGLEIDGAAADGSSISGLSVINFVNSAGIAVNASNTMLSGDYVGVTPDFATSTDDPTLTNNLFGIVLSGDGNTVQDSIVANSFATGIEVAGNGNQLLGNFVGTDQSGTIILANFGNGVDIKNASNTVVHGNLISGNGGNGVRVASSDHTTITGNFIGTDALGKGANGNSGDGVVLDTGATWTLVGGTDGAASRNVISGNSGNGVNVKSGAGDHNAIEGNYLGTDAAGMNAVPNGGNGANLGGDGVLVTGNVLSGNEGNGISIAGNNNTVVLNFIGTAADGATPLPGGDEKSDGVFVQGFDNVIGATGAGNVIAFNNNAGVVVFLGSGNAIRYNSVYGNGNIGIDLGDDGRTDNATADASRDVTGSNNNYQDYPVITGMTYVNGVLTITGTVSGTPGTSYTVDLYAAEGPDAGGSAQGRAYLMSVSVTTDAAGNATFSGSTSTVPATDPEGNAYTVAVATATDSVGNTSEFSQTFDIPGNTVVQQDANTTTTLSGGGSATIGQTVSFTAYVMADNGAMPLGTLNFYDNGSLVYQVVLDGSAASATWTTGSLALGSHTITASFVAADGFNDSASDPVNETVNQDATVTLLSSNTLVSDPNTAVTFTAVINAAHSFSGDVTGTVTFYDGNTVLGTMPVSGGQAVLSAKLSVGSHTITATYNGDTNHATSTSAALTETINAPVVLSTISGHVYRDTSGNGLSADDTALSGVTVKLFKDTNGNGVYDSGDKQVTSAVSGVDGKYSFAGLANGRYFVVEMVPTGYLQTAPATTTYYTENATGSTYTADFDNYMKCGCSANVRSIYYTINGCYTKYTDLRGHTHEGDTVTVHFTVLAHHTETLSFVTYTAPDSYFNANDASQQLVYNYQTGTFTAGSCNKSFTMTVKIPRCDYQIDFVCGHFIDKLGPAGSNIFYTPQGRLFSADNGGTHSAFGVTPIGGTVLSE